MTLRGRYALICVYPCPHPFPDGRTREPVCSPQGRRAHCGAKFLTAAARTGGSGIDQGRRNDPYQPA